MNRTGQGQTGRGRWEPPSWHMPNPIPGLCRLHSHSLTHSRRSPGCGFALGYPLAIRYDTRYTTRYRPRVRIHSSSTRPRGMPASPGHPRCLLHEDDDAFIVSTLSSVLYLSKNLRHIPCHIISFSRSLCGLTQIWGRFSTPVIAETLGVNPSPPTPPSVSVSFARALL